MVSVNGRCFKCPTEDLAPSPLGDTGGVPHWGTPCKQKLTGGRLLWEPLARASWHSDEEESGVCLGFGFPTGPQSSGKAAAANPGLRGFSC